MSNNEFNQLTEQDKQESHNILGKDEVSRDEITKLMNSRIFKIFEKDISDKTQQIKINLLLLGATGAGKSSLINRMFGNDVLKISHTRPQTRGIGDTTNTVETNTFRFYDSEGYEIGKEEKFKNNIDSFLRQKQNNKEEFPHCVIYCLQIAKPRIEDIDLKTIKLVKESYKLPVIIALTKFDAEQDESCPITNGFKRILTSNGISEKDIFTLTENKNDAFKPYDQMRNLIECLGAKLDDYMMQQKISMIATADHVHIAKDDDSIISFENLRNFKPSDELFAEVEPQYVSNERREQAKSNKIDNIIYAHTAAAVGAAVIPIPVADAVALVGIQTNLARMILDEYGISNAPAVIISLVPQIILTTLGKSLAGSLIKFIPFARTWVGGAINVTVASALTFAFGKGMQILCEELLSNNNANASVNEIVNVIDNLHLIDTIQTMFDQKQTELKSTK